jgi:nucleoside-diphosphate-sugar epimerase
LPTDVCDLEILVTGGAGFIGSYLCEQLIHGGAKVTCLDNMSTEGLSSLSHIRRLRKFRLVPSDILNRRSVKKAFRDVDVVFPLATKVGERHYVENSHGLILTNVLAIHNLLEAIRPSG